VSADRPYGFDGDAFALIDPDFVLVEPVARPLRANGAGHRTESGPGLHPDHPEAEKEVSPPAPLFVPAMELTKAPPTQWIVEGVAVAGGITVLVGESSAGKTFVAMGMGAAIVDGQPWFGLPTQKGSVAYVAYERDALGLRFQALHEHGGASLEDFYVMRATEPISPRIAHDGIECASMGEVTLIDGLRRLSADLWATGRPPIVAMFIDTVRASMIGSEDNSADVSAYLRAVRRVLGAVPSAAGIPVHHAGWQDGEQRRKRERGSSAFRGNVDATLYVEVEEEDLAEGRARLTIRTLKTRDAERPAPIRAIRERVNVACRDRHGTPLTSCVVVPDTRTKVDREAAATAVQEAADRKLDGRVLRVIRDFPTATSLDRIRPYVKVSKTEVSGAVGRLLNASLITAGKRGEPYKLTEDGQRVAAESPA